MKLISKALFSFFAGIALFGAVGFLINNSAAAHDGVENAECGPECRAQIAAVRAVTAKYHDVQKALEAGFVPASPCVALPTGPAMGFHYVNFDKVLDGTISANDPEVLLYAPKSDGSLSLVAVEYMVPSAMSPAAPELYGREFEPGPNATWTLHAWIWRNNPDGTFAGFNPKVSCPAQ